MLADLLNHTGDVLAQTTAADDLRGIVPSYTTLYESVACRFEDLGGSQIEALMQQQIDAQHRVLLQLPGAINENRSGFRFEGALYRVTKANKRRGIGGLETFDVLLLTRWVP